MNKKLTPKKWLALFAALTISFGCVACGMTYVVDPYMQYRAKDGVYMLNGIYVCEGLIKNYEYDTLIIGSSMTQNFDMDCFRKELGAAPLHIGLGGMNWREMEELLCLAEKTGKASEYYIGVDLYNFTNDEDDSVLPWYLLEDSVLAKVRYSLSYESWFRFMPVDAAFSLLEKCGYEFPERYFRNMQVDYLENWALDVSFGEDVVLENYQSDEFSVSAVDTEDLLHRMYEKIDIFVSFFEGKTADYHFFFPPYSSLYWCDAQTQGYYDSYAEAKCYFIEKMTDLGYEVYDFQSAEFTMDLNCYKDTTHYAPEINDWMVDCFASGEYLATPENEQKYREKLLENTSIFRVKYRDVLK